MLTTGHRHNVFVVYTCAGHVCKLACKEYEGAKEVEGVDVTLMQASTTMAGSGVTLTPLPSLQLSTGAACESRSSNGVEVFVVPDTCLFAASHVRRAAVSVRRLGPVAQFPETLSEEVLAKMHAAPKADLPVADVHDLPNYDGFILGFPTRCAPNPLVVVLTRGPQRWQQEVRLLKDNMMANSTRSMSPTCLSPTSCGQGRAHHAAVRAFAPDGRHRP